MSTHDKAHNPSTISYLVGFILAVFFTLGSFIPVMYGMLDSWAVSTKVIYLIGMALIQIVVQIVFFLHLNSGPDAKWNWITLWFAAMCVFIIIGGTWWAISHLNYNMMGGSGRIIVPKVLEMNVTEPEGPASSMQEQEEQTSIQEPEEPVQGTQEPASSVQQQEELAPDVQEPASNVQTPEEPALKDSSSFND
ncbi:cytochrome o ubiquinol oxidase subunit IV [Bartonella sp. WD12.1]|uniref:cytochrome o ubiquinol oxidase subunit IV n=1 Tax=Bartonella sp. WD12.1 TaxID=1933903 RepID=UPI00099A3226|nr:cytochrome o ubiquinol oxidase subunit IV [Bartonella sp. WD12.1]OPB30489.1 cytochrome bo3 quinol oxidase subunit 4 [Bartonella sp. WD12.1]